MSAGLLGAGSLAGGHYWLAQFLPQAILQSRAPTILQLATDGVDANVLKSAPTSDRILPGPLRWKPATLEWTPIDALAGGRRIGLSHGSGAVGSQRRIESSVSLEPIVL